MASRVSIGSGLAVLALGAALSGCGGSASKSPAGAVTERGQFGVYYFVSVPKPTGGTIRSSDGQINCGTAAGATQSCGPARYDWSTQATFTASADPGYTFYGWAGDCSGAGACTVDNSFFAADKTIAAVFTLGTSWTLEVTKIGTGTGTVAAAIQGKALALCPPEVIRCQFEVPISQSPLGVTLTAGPDAVSTFGGWGSPCQSSGSCALTVSRSTSITAAFSPGAAPPVLVDPSGGTVQDSSGVTLSVPPGAVTADVPITVTMATAPPPDATAVSALYDFQPSGLVFAQPATVTLPVPPGSGGVEVYWSTPDGSGYEPVPSIVSGDTVQAQVSHFSTGYVARSQALSWLTKAPMPTGRYEGTAAVVGGKVYVIGGVSYQNQNPRFHATVEAYDPATNTWQSKSPMPTARSGVTAAAVNGKIYAMGGYAGWAANEEYDPATDRWTTKASIPTTRQDARAVALDGKVYLIGGYSGGNRLTSVEVYDPATNTWASKAPLPVGWTGGAAVVLRGRIHVLGGYDASQASTRLMVYDPASDAWTLGNPMPSLRGSLAAVSMNGQIYSFGGQYSASLTEAYDSASGSWSSIAPMPIASGIPSTALLDGKAYVFGAGAALNVVQEFTPPQGLLPGGDIAVQKPVFPGANQYDADVAFDGTNYLVVWSDAPAGVNNPTRIYAALVSPAGRFIQARSLHLSREPAQWSAEHPRVTFSNGRYLVAWQSAPMLTPTGGSFGPSEIHAMRVDTNGNPLDLARVVIGPGIDPGLASDGTNFLVGFTSFTGEVRAARVRGNDGAVLDPGGILLAQEQNAAGFAAAFDGTNYLVAWETGTTLRVTGISPALASVHSTVTAVLANPGTISKPSVDYSNGFFLMTYFASGRIYGYLFSGGAANFAGVYGGLAISPDGVGTHRAGVAHRGDVFLVAYRDNFGLYTVQVTKTATVGARNALSGSLAGESICVAVGATEAMITTAPHYSPSRAYFTRVSTTGAFLDSVPTSMERNNDAEQPAVAFDGTNYLVVWHDDRGGDQDIYAARVSPSGTVLDPDGILVSGASRDQYSPRVAFDGTNYLVVWEDGRNSGRNVYGARVTKAGAVLDPNGISIVQGPQFTTQPVLAFGGGTYLVAWSDLRAGGYHPYFSRVSTSGAVLDPGGVALSSGLAYSDYDPAVASDGSGFLVTWGDGRVSTARHIYGARIGATGAVLDPGGFPISTAADQGAPVVAYGQSNYLVAWGDGRTNTTRAARVRPDGTVLDTTDLNLGANAYQYHPNVAFDGKRWVVVSHGWTGAGLGLVARPVGVDGTIDGPEQIVAPGVDTYYQQWVMPGLASDSAGNLLTTYFTSGRDRSNAIRGRLLKDVLGR